MLKKYIWVARMSCYDTAMHNAVDDPRTSASPQCHDLQLAPDAMTLTAPVVLRPKVLSLSNIPFRISTQQSVLWGWSLSKLQ